MARITLGGFEIRPDGNGAGWVLVEDRPKQKGKSSKGYEVVGYYATITDAIEGLLKRRLRTSEAEGLREVVEEVRAFRREVHALLQGV